MEQHPLVEQACDMGFDRDQAVAALVSFADSKAGASVRQLTVQKYGEEYIDFLFSFDRPAQQKQPQQQPKQCTQQYNHHQQPQQRRNSRQQPQRGCKRLSPDLDSVDSAAEDSGSQGDSDFIVDDSKQQQDEDEWDAGLHAQHTQQQTQPKQQPRKRLRRSCEAARPAPAVAAGAGAGAAEDPCSDSAVQIARHRRRVLQDSSSDDDGEPGAGGHQYSAAVAAAAAADGSGQHTASKGPASARSRYQHAANDLDFMITQVTPAPVAAAAAGLGSARGTSGMPQQPQQQQPMRSQGKHAQAQTKQKKAAADADPQQAKLERFFSTPAHQVSTGAAGAAAGAAAGVGRSGPSPLTFSRVTSSSMRPSDRSFASRMAAGEGGMGPGAAKTPAGGYKTPAQALRGPANHAHAALAAAGYGRAGGMGGAAAGQYLHGYGAAAAAGGPVAPWYQTLAEDEAALDHFDLVNLKVFGHSSFRPCQKKIVQQAVQGRDLFVLMPTGGGKSLCYQLPAVMRPGVTVVVCPLLSLMQDQVRALCQNPNGGIPASFLSSQQSEAEAVAVKKELIKLSPTVKLLYVTPEQLVKSSALRRILHRLEQNGKLARFVIDEAHCVSTWGHDFRPDYKGLRVLRAEFKQTPITAVTATATREVQADILSTLGITRTVTVHQTSFLRPNLLLRVVPKVREQDPDSDSGVPLYITKLIGYIKKQTAIAEAKAAGTAIKQEHAQQQQQQQRVGGSSGKVNCSGIVYCLSRKEAEGVAQVLQEQGGVKAAHYHAGMTPKQRTEVQNAFFSGALQVIVATIAFGMGIDKPDVRFVVHFCMSKSLEGYYQEAGRAGRDGQPAECVLMYSNSDINRHMFILRKSMGGSKSTDRFAKAVDQLDTMKQYAMASNVCRHAQLLEYFGVVQTDLPERTCTHSCDVCRGEVVPLDPKDWAPPEEGDGMCADELEGPIDLLEEDSEDIEQQQRSGGRRRPSLYNGVVGDAGEGGGQGGSEGIEILDSGSEDGNSGSDGSESEDSEGGSEESSEDEGGSDSSAGWEDDGEGSEGEDSPRDAAAAATEGVAGRRPGAGSRSDRQARRPQQQQRQQQPAAPAFQGIQTASQLQAQEELDVHQEQQQQYAANRFQRLLDVQGQRQQQRQKVNHPAAHNPQQQQQQQQQQRTVAGGQLGRAQQPDQQPAAAGFGGFQRASALQQQQQQHVQNLPQQGKQQQQQQQPGAGQAGLGLGSSRFNRFVGGGLSRQKTAQQQQHQGKPGAAAAGFVSASALQGTGVHGDASTAAPPAAAAAASSKPGSTKPAVGLAAGADVPWIEKKSSGSSGGKRLGMCGGSGSGSGSLSRGLGGAVRGSKPSPADALAAELQAADACDMF